MKKILAANKKYLTAVATTVFAVFAAMSPSAQLSDCVPGAPLTVQPVEPVVQFTPPPGGSVSLSVTLFAVPGPRLVTTMVNVAVSPAVTVPPASPGKSGLLAIVSTGV